MRGQKLSESDLVFKPNLPDKRFKDLKGKVFGRLTVLGFAGRTVEGKCKQSRWFCRCECGELVKVPTQPLISGESKSCGCLAAELASQRLTVHGDCQSHERHYLYTTRRSIIARCCNPKNKDYVRYGATGITLFEEWRNLYIAFRDYILTNLGERPADHQLDRRDNERGYEPGNLRWATPSENASNRRDTRFITIDGVTKTMADWANSPGADSKSKIEQRIRKGWTPEEAVFGRNCCKSAVSNVAVSK